MSELATIVGIGEVLWDVFPDGPRFGGAPANFACCAAALADGRFRVQMVSGVGNDELGSQALAQLVSHGVDVEAVQRLPLQTGQVFVRIDARGHASYEFASNTAWDNIAWTNAMESTASRAAAVCFGTLGQRCSTSKETIQRFMRCVPQRALRLLDINLRSPHWNEQTIVDSLRLANAVKLNSDELPMVAKLHGWQGGDVELLHMLRTHYSLRLVALTRGSEGSIVLTETGQSERPGQKVQVVDTVGAGDAFTAAMVVGLLLNRPLIEWHNVADEVAAYVCTQPGATPKIPAALVARLQ